MQRIAVLILLGLVASALLAFVIALIQSISKEAWKRVGRKCYSVSAFSGGVTVVILIGFAVGWTDPIGVLLTAVSVCLVSALIGFHANPI